MIESKPLMTCRKRMDDIKTEAVWTWSGMSLGATCLLLRRCPAWRGHELGSGPGAERGNLRSRKVRPFIWVNGPPVVKRETPEWQKPRGVEYRLRDAGADRPAVAMKAL